MKKLLNASFNSWTLSGFIVIIAGALFGIWYMTNQYIPKSTNHFVTVDSLEKIMDNRYQYNDSVNQVSNKNYIDSLLAGQLRQHIFDSTIYYFQNEKNKIYEEKINNINHASNPELLRFWSERYGK